jgi:hypothetical protein
MDLKEAEPETETETENADARGSHQVMIAE